MSNKNSLPQSIVSIKVARQHVTDLVDHVGINADDIDFNEAWATISWTAIGGVEELDLVEAIKESGAGEPKVTELS
tara:strand:+ start:789 stop:1016 length:228 start_codon:yes stop_codon:yes gene_type:complete